MNLKALIEEAKKPKEEPKPKEEQCTPPHPGESCHANCDRTAAELIGESDGKYPRPNQKVWDMFAEHRAELAREDWAPPFPEVYDPVEAPRITATPQRIQDSESDPDPFEQAHRDMGF